MLPETHLRFVYYEQDLRRPNKSYMKKIIVSAGLLVAGAGVLQAANTSDLSQMEQSKWWSISAFLRGFYDDNVATAPSPAAGQPSRIQNSFGTELGPTLGVNWKGNQLTLVGAYQGTFKYNEHQDFTQLNHLLSLKADESFSPKYRLTLSERFAVAQDPQILEPGVISNPHSTLLRSSQSGINNMVNAKFSDQITDTMGADVGYDNTIYDYEQHGIGSLGAILNRMEQAGSANLRWQVMNQTTAVFGYKFQDVDYTSKDPLFTGGPTGKIRNNQSHFLMAGVDQMFTSQLSGSARVGAQIIDYYNAPGTPTKVSPYADASLSYQYASGSSAQVGIRHQHIATDTASGSATNPVLDSEATAVYASVTHKFTGKLNANGVAQFQHSDYNGGGPGFDNKRADFYLLNLNLSYQYNPHISSEVGWNYSNLGSQLAGWSYDRNVFYLGVRATY